MECTPAPSVAQVTSTSDRPTLAISDVSAGTGLSPDTLRWYERMGLLPRVPRSSDGRRAYPAQLLDFVLLVAALRRSGLSVAGTRAFVQLAEEGAASHGRRMALLQQHREDVQARRRQLDDDLAAVETKIAHYRDLVERGLDCDGLPVDAATAHRQRAAQ